MAWTALQRARLVLPAVLMMAAALLTTSAAAQEATYGKIQVVVVHGWDSDGRGVGNATLMRHEHHLHLRTKSGQLRRLLFPADAPEWEVPRTGALVYVKSQPLSSCTKDVAPVGAICVASLMAHEAAPRDVYARGQPRGSVNAKVLLIQLDVCNMGIPSPDWDELEGAMWLGMPKTKEHTVEGMFKACSFDMAQVGRAIGGSTLKIPVPVPCSGATPQGQPFDSSQCPFNEWADVADAWIRANAATQVNLDDYPTKVYIVPRGKTCAWGGMGYVGCLGDCRVWIQGDLWNEPVTYLHEISHNMFLNHAGKWGNRGYEDLSGAMGYCCDLRCHNAPHAHQLGWAGPVKTLHKDNFPADTWHTYVLPASITSPRNFIKVWPDWSPQAARYKLYLQYRKRQGFDAELSTQEGPFGDAVILYSADAADPQPYTSWEAGIPIGQQLTETRLGSELVIQVLKAQEKDSVAVRVCRGSCAGTAGASGGGRGAPPPGAGGGLFGGAGGGGFGGFPGGR